MAEEKKNAATHTHTYMGGHEC